MLSYLIGNKDFYKIIKGGNYIEIQGFNLNGNLNKSFKNIKPKANVAKIKLPTKIIDFSFKPDSKDTLILVCNEGWQISFRLHSASSKVEPSLKFDVNIIGHPHNLYSHHI